MLAGLSYKVIKLLIDKGIIRSDEEDIYRYGVEQLFVIILNVVTTIIIGFLFGMVWHSIVFMVMYLPIRSYAGGYHARTQKNCYVLGIIISVIALWIIKTVSTSDLLIVSLAVFAGLIILILAPVEDSNKPLDQLEKLVFKRRTIILLLCDICIINILLILNCKSTAKTITVALFTLGIMLVLGIILKTIREKYHYNGSNVT